MTKAEFMKYVSGPLFMAFNDRQQTKQLIGMYYANLQDINVKTAANAVKQLIQTEQYFPTIAAIRKACTQIAHPELGGTTTEASELIQDAIHKYNYSRPKEAVEYIKQKNVLAYKIVKSIGFTNICKANAEFVYPRIDRLYREEQKAASRTEQLSPEVRLELEKARNDIQNNALTLLGGGED